MNKLLTRLSLLLLLATGPIAVSSSSAWPGLPQLVPGLGGNYYGYNAGYGYRQPLPFNYYLYGQYLPTYYGYGVYPDYLGYSWF